MLLVVEVASHYRKCRREAVSWSLSGPGSRARRLISARDCSGLRRGERADSVVGGAPIAEEEDGEPWSEGLSDFKVDREEDYLSPDF